MSGQDKEKNEGVGVVGVMLEEDPLQGCEIGRFYVAPSQRARGVRLRQWVTPQAL